MTSNDIQWYHISMMSMPDSGSGASCGFCLNYSAWSRAPFNAKNCHPRIDGFDTKKISCCFGKLQGFDFRFQWVFNVLILEFSMLLTGPCLQTPQGSPNVPTLNRIGRKNGILRLRGSGQLHLTTSMVSACRHEGENIAMENPPFGKSISIGNHGNFHCYVRLQDSTSNCSGWFIEIFIMVICKAYIHGQHNPIYDIDNNRPGLHCSLYVGWGMFVLDGIPTYTLLHDCIRGRVSFATTPKE